MAFASVEEIQQHYAEAINAAGNDAAVVVQLESQKRDELAAFREQQIAERERQIWVREAVHEFPLARSFPQLLSGETEDEIRNSAKQVHEQLTEAFQEHQRSQEMRRLWEISQNPPKETPSEPTV